MILGSPPLRFLVAVVGGWVAMRWAMLAPVWRAEQNVPNPRAEPVAAQSHRATPAPAYPPPTAPARFASSHPAARAAARPAVMELPPAFAPIAGTRSARREPAISPGVQPPPLPSAARPSGGRWSVSAWALVRRGGSGGLAVGGTLGGSQAGARLVYRLSRPLSLSARLSAPVGGAGGAEAALGIEWKPATALPLRLLAERRQAFGSSGRSAFALLAHGGFDGLNVTGRLRLDAYAQAGIVGLRSREPFADGSVRLSRPIDAPGRFRLGAGIWGAAQRGAARLDAGPRAELRLPGMTVALDWRLRLAGDAAPSSGPALTLAADF